MAVIEISFPGGAQVDAKVREFTVRTDQPDSAGGSNTAPTPFELFLASLGTCAGIYAVGFCEQRDITTEGLSLKMETFRNPETGLVGDVVMNLTVPKGFPTKYESAIIKSMELCAVKKHLAHPPSFKFHVLQSE